MTAPTGRGDGREQEIKPDGSWITEEILRAQERWAELPAWARPVVTRPASPGPLPMTAPTGPDSDRTGSGNGQDGELHWTGKPTGFAFRPAPQQPPHQCEPSCSCGDQYAQQPPAQEREKREDDQHGADRRAGGQADRGAEHEGVLVSVHGSGAGLPQPGRPASGGRGSRGGQPSGAARGDRSGRSVAPPSEADSAGEDARWQKLAAEIVEVVHSGVGGYGTLLNRGRTVERVASILAASSGVRGGDGEARERLAAVLALHVAHPCSCGGRRWNEDENWEPEDYERGREREEGAGLIPCGFCNLGGWNTDQWDPEGAVSCEECDQDFPCPTVCAAGGSR